MSDKKTRLLASLSENKREDWWEDLERDVYYPEHGGYFVSLYTPKPMQKDEEVYALFMTAKEFDFKASQILDIGGIFKEGTLSRTIARLTQFSVNYSSRTSTYNNAFSADGSTGMKFNNYVKSFIPELSGLPKEDWYIPSMEEYMMCSEYYSRYNNYEYSGNPPNVTPARFITMNAIPPNGRRTVNSTRSQFKEDGTNRTTRRYITNVGEDYTMAPHRDDYGRTHSVMYSEASESDSNVKLVRQVYCYTKTGSDIAGESTNQFQMVYGNSANPGTAYARNANFGELVPSIGIKGTLPLDVKNKDEITVSFHTRRMSGATALSPNFVISPFGTATSSVLLSCGIKFGNGVGFVGEGINQSFLSSTSQNFDPVFKMGTTHLRHNRRESTTPPVGEWTYYRVTLNKKFKYIEFEVIPNGSRREENPIRGRVDATTILNNLGENHDTWYIGDINAESQSATYEFKNVRIYGRDLDYKRRRKETIPRPLINDLWVGLPPKHSRAFGHLRMESSESGLNVQYDQNIMSGVDIIQNMGARFKIDGTRGRGTVFRCTFETDSYFTAQNLEHIAIGIRGNIYRPDGTMALTGKGVVIGNVTGYPTSSGVCKPTTKVNTVAIESFWDGGNCVYGDSEVSTVMGNSTTRTQYEYQLTIIVDDIDKTVRFGIGGIINEYHDPFYDNSPSDDYWFIGTVPSGRDWSFNLYNVVAYHYDNINELPEDMR